MWITFVDGKKDVKEKLGLVEKLPIKSWSKKLFYMWRVWCKMVNHLQENKFKTKPENCPNHKALRQAKDGLKDFTIVILGYLPKIYKMKNKSLDLYLWV